MNPKPFNQRCKHLIRQVCRQRMILITYGKSKVPLTKDQCLKVINEIQILNSDRQMAKYVETNSDLLFYIIPGLNSKAIASLRQLKSEAQSLLQQ